MSFTSLSLTQPRPDSIRADVGLPRRQQSHASPVDWRDEVLYFLRVDRFSDGAEATRPLLDRANPAAARPAQENGEPWRWDRWAESGASRWQGGTLAGVTSKLDYLKNLGVTTLWLSPVFKQRGHRDDYHGYGVQDFLDVMRVRHPGRTGRAGPSCAWQRPARHPRHHLQPLRPELAVPAQQPRRRGTTALHPRPLSVRRMAG